MGYSRAESSAFDTAVHYITFRDRTLKEVHNKLVEKGYSDHDIEEAIAKLKYYGYVDDEHYALSYIRSNAEKKGVKRIKVELSQKGISSDVISQTLEESEIDEVNVIEELLERRYSTTDISDEKARRRIYSFFARRGFSYENISRALSNYKKMS